jgi:hypothetical protein
MASRIHDEIIVFLRKVKVFLDFWPFAQIAGTNSVICPIKAGKFYGRLFAAGGR